MRFSQLSIYSFNFVVCCVSEPITLSFVHATLGFLSLLVLAMMCSAAFTPAAHSKFQPIDSSVTLRHRRRPDRPGFIPSVPWRGWNQRSVTKVKRHFKSSRQTQFACKVTFPPFCWPAADFAIGWCCGTQVTWHQDKVFLFFCEIVKTGKKLFLCSKL